MNVNEFKIHIKQLTIVDKFIYINLLVFIFSFFINALAYLNTNSDNFIINYFALSKNTDVFLSKPYTFITYGFLHINFIHILFNLIALYYLGNLFTQFFSNKEFIIYYLIGSVFGGIFFILSYQYFPVFKNKQGILLGASAGISAILVGLATKTPNYELNIRFIGYVKLWVLALGYLVLTIIFIPTANAGGQISHLGGAFIGFFLARYFHINPKKYKNKSNLKMVYKSNNLDDFGLSVHQKKVIKQQKIDSILDKISKSGYDSLTLEERDFLTNASK